MAPPSARKTSSRPQHAKATEQPAYESDQRSLSNTDDATSNREGDQKSTSFFLRALPMVSLSEAAARIDLFDGENPLVTARWLKHIERLYPEGSVWHGDRLVLAKMRLEGGAKAAIQRADPDDWEEFKKFLLKYVNPEAAISVLDEQLYNRTRYKGMPPMHAIQMAITDRLDLRCYCGAGTHDRRILKALMAIFPDTMLMAMCFSPAGDFDSQIKQLEKHVKAAIARNDSGFR
ncbi:hypothetical protein GQ54DRAFT_300163 [Martensiomyces pterosporus]|nr:hypothetical protein GQ54DRAFT_300163 [Martensiomyces pterosporus]